MIPSEDALQRARAVLLEPNGIDERDLQRSLDAVLSHQVDFADVYLQSSRRESWALESGQIRSGQYSANQGLGLRAIRHDETAFAYSQHLGESALTTAAEAVRSIAPAGRLAVTVPAPTTAFFRAPLYGHVDPLLETPAQDKVDLLTRIDRQARALSPLVQQIFASLSVSHDVVMVLRHDGRLAADVRPLVELSVTVVVERDGRRESCGIGRGGRHSLDEITPAQIDADLRRIVGAAIGNLDARPAPAGNMTVVVGPGWPGVLLHEAIGHGFEGDFNRLGSSVYAGKMGQRVAAAGVDVVDDGTLPHGRGSLNIDDEGESTQCTSLLEDGVLTGYLQDSLNARLSGMRPTGNGRRQSYAHLPMPRMTNTYLRAGQYEPQEVIGSVKRGLYLPMLGSGQVDIVNGQFSFEAKLAYLIEDGRVTAPVKGATLIGAGPDVIRKISMVGNDLEIDPGMGVCGKMGQTVPVGVGQPTIRVDDLTVGGTVQ